MKFSERAKRKKNARDKKSERETESERERAKTVSVFESMSSSFPHDIFFGKSPSTSFNINV